MLNNEGVPEMFLGESIYAFVMVEELPVIELLNIDNIASVVVIDKAQQKFFDDKVSSYYLCLVTLRDGCLLQTYVSEKNLQYAD
jgi:hypothetical protein